MPRAKKVLPGDVVPAIPAVAVAVPTTPAQAMRNAFSWSVGAGAMDKLLPYVVAALALVAGVGYLFGFIPTDRITGLVSLAGGLGAGFYVRSAGSNAHKDHQ